MRKSVLLIGLLFSVFLSACGNNESIVKKDENEPVEEKGKDNAPSIVTSDFYESHKGNLEHVHGLGYAGNQNAIFFAAHDGLKVYEDGEWYKTKEQNNDYMGFNAVDQGFYTSGHPENGVDLPNPLGLKRSLDNGQTLEDLGLEGESDFHAMGVGYKNHAVYVLNGQKNSMMGQGLYVTKDDGESWTEIEADKLGAKIFSIAVHPTNDKIVAVAGQDGIFLSTDGGQSFQLLTSGKQGTSVFFSEDTLWYGVYSQAAPVLVKHSIESGDEEVITLPKMEQDAVMYLTQNPKNSSEIVFVTFKGSVYLSKDGANTWNPLVKEGKIQ